MSQGEYTLAENERKYSNVINIDCKRIVMELKYN